MLGNQAHLAALFAILVAATILRLWNIGRESLWADEALTPVLALWPVSEMIWYPTDETPFLYYTLHKLLIPDGASATLVRSISAAAGISSVLAIYALGRLALGRRAGLLCAALLAVWPYHIDYSQEARAYSLLFLLTTVSAASLLWWFRATETVRQRTFLGSKARHLALALFATSTTLTFYAHLLAVIWIGCALQILVSLTARLRPRRFSREVIAASAVMALLAAPGIIRLARKLRVPDAFHWLPQATPAQFLGTISDVFLPKGPGPILLLAAIATASAVYAVRRGSRGCGSGAWRSPRHLPAVWIGIAFLLLPVLVWMFGYAIRPVFMPRTILFAIPGVILLLAAILNPWSGRRSYLAFSSLTVAAYLGSTLSNGTVREKEEWAGVHRFLAVAVRPGDLILICPPWKFPAARHAAAAAPVPAPALLPDGRSMLQLEQRHGADTHWTRSYFEQVTRRNQRYREVPPLKRSQGRLTVRAGSSLWLVESECEKSSSDQIARWVAGNGHWQLRLRSEAKTFRDLIEVRQMTLTRPLSTPIELPDDSDR